MRPILFAVLALAAAVLAPSAGAAGCTYGNSSLCDPALPGVDLAPELSEVTIADAVLRQSGGRWLLDLSLATTDHPGEVKIRAWRWGFTDQRTWVASPGSTSNSQSVAGIDVGPADPASPSFGAHMVSVEWESNGATWSRHVNLHRGREINDPAVGGNYYFTAGEGSAVPWWLTCEYNPSLC